jgi:hypothetical protein
MYKLMAENHEVTPEAEKIAPKEGTVEAEIVKDTKVEPTVEPKKEADTVPLSVYLSLKDDVKELKKEILEAKNSNKSTVLLDGVEDLAKKYPDVDKDFINDILSSATSKAQKEIDSKYSPIIAKQEAEKAKEVFDKAFDKVFDKAVTDNADLPKNIDKEVIKALALTPAYKNTPISEILLKVYGGVDTGTATTENETRAAGDTGEIAIDFTKMSAEQKEQVLADPKSRKKYFDYLDRV